ncbi:MAG: gliding motility-associated C-terminal domain-containing protein [Bacteroidota bacterium]|nr:gliding motility-associated C-terminal domain-containing protein [Bacteroidota bacterium]
MYVYDQYSRLLQYDLQVGTEEEIKKSKVVLLDGRNRWWGEMQLAPDGKIYISIFDTVKSHRFTVINQPNKKGIQCNIVLEGFDLGVGRAFRFPQPAHWYLQPKVNFTYETHCSNNSVSFTGSAPYGADSWQWDFGDATGNSSNLPDPVYVYTAPGAYRVCLVIHKSGVRDTVFRDVQVSPAFTLNLGEDKIICRGATVSLGADHTADDYLWSTGERTVVINTATPGTYWLRATKNVCVSTDTARIIWPKEIEVQIKGPPIHCFDEGEMMLKTGEASDYLWWPGGETTRAISIEKEGIYVVRVTDIYGCHAYDTITVTGQCPPKVFIPNSFSPNGDGINDTFKIIVSDVSQLQLNIYSRWGQPLFTSEDTNTAWDGSYNEAPLPDGIYIYSLWLKGKNGEAQYQKGTITLMK